MAQPSHLGQGGWGRASIRHHTRKWLSLLQYLDSHTLKFLGHSLGSIWTLEGEWGATKHVFLFEGSAHTEPGREPVLTK